MRLLARPCIRCSNSNFTLMFIIHFIVLLPFALSLSFNITRFDPAASNIIYEGDAAPDIGHIELNTVKYTCRVGHATYAKPVQLWDSSTGTVADFTTHFSFSVDVQIPGQDLYGNGFAFFLAPVGFGIPPNSDGGFLGMLNTTTFAALSRNQILMVEFDTYVNPEWDPPMEHVGINNNSISSVAYAAWEGGTRSRQVSHAWIAYNATTKNLSVYWQYESDPTAYMGNHTLTYIIDITKVIPEWVTIGFSGATGQYKAYHTINTWEFSSSWVSNKQFGEETPSWKGRGKKTFLFVAAAICFFFVMIGVAAGCFIIKRRRSKKDVKYGLTENSDLEREALPKIFSYEELSTATNGFADDRRLGRGGSGQVYKGTSIKLGRLIAVKRIVSAGQHTERIFQNEVKIISRLIHRNLVQFIGWCQEQGEFLLVYAYMPNGSLDNHLFGDRRTLPWSDRYRIVLGLASALHYLHEDVEQYVLHRDIKSANVLLDTDFSTKLADFGVSKLVDPNLRTQMTGLVGTCGYLAPEYVSEGRASKESDMYSFGVVALEIACGRKTYQDGEYHVPLWRWVWQLYLEGNILNAADERLAEIFNAQEMQCLLIVGLWCTHPKDKERPKAGQVIKFLQFEVTVTQPPLDMHDPARPATHNASLQDDSSLSSTTSSLNNTGS